MLKFPFNELFEKSYSFMSEFLLCVGPCLSGRNTVMNKARQSCGPFCLWFASENTQTLDQEDVLMDESYNLKGEGEGGLGLTNLVIDNRELQLSSHLEMLHVAQNLGLRFGGFNINKINAVLLKDL